MSSKKFVLYPPVPTTSRGVSVKLSANKSRISYANGKSVVIRDVNDPAISLAYTEHTANTTISRFSPSGYYVASADVSGAVRIWDVVNPDLATKHEYRVLGGRINDLDWDGEGKRIIAVGGGSDKFGHAFMVDTGSSTGEISGHSKSINAVAIRHQRPFRAATAADDSTIVFHQGPPFKYEKVIKTHTKFVQDLRYARGGNHFASVGADAKAFLYDGKTGDVLGEFEGDLHTGNIMALSWVDDQSLATASLDSTVKLWDVETRKSTSTFSVGTGVDNQQVGIVYTEGSIVSLSASGNLNVLDPRVQGVTRVLEGPQKAVTAAAVLDNTSTFLAGTADGRVVHYDFSSHTSTLIKGDSHTNLVSGIAASQGGAVTVGYDDRVKEIQSSSFVPSTAPTSSQPKSVAADTQGFYFVAGIQSIEVFKSSQKVHEIKPSYTPSSIAANGQQLAVGGEDNIVYLYAWDGQVLKPTGRLEGNKGTVSALAFSPDGSLVAAGDSAGKIILYNTQDKNIATSRWAYHTARVNSLSFRKDGAHVASGSLDTHAYVWSVTRPLKSIAIKNAGPGGINAVFWIDVGEGKTGRLATTGADACVRVWDVTFHA